MTVRYLEAAVRDKMEEHKRDLMRQSKASPVRGKDCDASFVYLYV